MRKDLAARCVTPADATQAAQFAWRAMRNFRWGLSFLIPELGPECLLLREPLSGRSGLGLRAGPGSTSRGRRCAWLITGSLSVVRLPEALLGAPSKLTLALPPIPVAQILLKDQCPCNPCGEKLLPHSLPAVSNGHRRRLHFARLGGCRKRLDGLGWRNVWIGGHVQVLAGLASGAGCAGRPRVCGKSRIIASPISSAPSDGTSSSLLGCGSSAGRLAEGWLERLRRSR